MHVHTHFSLLVGISHCDDTESSKKLLTNLVDPWRGKKQITTTFNNVNRTSSFMYANTSLLHSYDARVVCKLSLALLVKTR